MVSLMKPIHSIKIKINLISPLPFPPKKSCSEIPNSSFFCYHHIVKGKNIILFLPDSVEIFPDQAPYNNINKTKSKNIKGTIITKSSAKEYVSRISNKTSTIFPINISPHNSTKIPSCRQKSTSDIPVYRLADSKKSPIRSIVNLPILCFLIIFSAFPKLVTTIFSAS